MPTNTVKIINLWCIRHSSYTHLRQSKKINEWCNKNNVNCIKIMDAEGIYFVEQLLEHGRIYNNDYINKCSIVDTFVIEYYKKRKNFYKLIEYYTIMCAKGNVEALYQLGEYYKEYEDDPEQMVKHYKLCAEQSHPIAIFELGLYYESTGDIDNMIKYFEISAKTNSNLYAMNALGRYYELIGKYEQMMCYYSLILETGNKCDYDQIKSINKFFDTCAFIPHLAYKCKSVLEKKYRERLNSLIDIHITMLQCVTIHKDECGVCFNESYMQPFLQCTHFVCSDCFKMINCCPFCRKGK